MTTTITATEATIRVQHGPVSSMELALRDGPQLVATLRDGGHQLTVMITDAAYLSSSSWLGLLIFASWGDIDFALAP